MKRRSFSKLLAGTIVVAGTAVVGITYYIIANSNNSSQGEGLSASPKKSPESSGEGKTQTQTLPSPAISAEKVNPQPPTSRELFAITPDILDPAKIVGAIISGGPPKDGIPAITRPKYVSMADADKLLTEGSLVFGLDYKGVVKAFPHDILVWHEIVDDRVSGRDVVISYCPLTGSTIGYKGTTKDEKDITCGVSGRLYNSNLVMYDHQTDSFWPQLYGVAIEGPSKGLVLDEFSMIYTTWGRWKARYPDTLVLSRETGYFRSYGLEPYGGYYESGEVIFPLTGEDRRFHPKKLVTGIRMKNDFLAVPKSEFSKVKVANVNVGGVPLVLFHDDGLATIRAFVRRVEGRELNFKLEASKFIDEETRSEWSYLGKGIEGSYGKVQLQQVNVWDLFWFAWYAFYPNTKVLHV